MNDSDEWIDPLDGVGTGTSFIIASDFLPFPSRPVAPTCLGPMQMQMPDTYHHGPCGSVPWKQALSIPATLVSLEGLLLAPPPSSEEDGWWWARR